MLEAVIFDMDGLLIDSEPLWIRAEIEVFGRHGVLLAEEDCTLTKGLRVDDVVAYWHQRKAFTNATPAEVESHLVTRVAELIAAEGRALPGIATALAAARAGGRKIALASSSTPPIITAALSRLGLSTAFDVVHSAATEAYGKPHPAVFLATATRLGVSPLACIVIEDSMTGVVAAKAARMRCVAVPFDHPSHDPRFVLADIVLGTLEAVTSEMLEGLLQF